MCGGCGKIPDAVMTDVSASCWRSNVSFSQARSSIGILPILENVLFENVLFVSLCRRMHSRIAWYVSEVNSVYQGLFQSVVVVHLKYMAAIVEAVVLSVVIISACRLGWRDSHALLVRVMFTSPVFASDASLRHKWWLFLLVRRVRSIWRR